jgi:hypothetical protein
VFRSDDGTVYFSRRANGAVVVRHLSVGGEHVSTAVQLPNGDVLLTIGAGKPTVYKQEGAAVSSALGQSYVLSGDSTDEWGDDDGNCRRENFEAFVATAAVGVAYYAMVGTCIVGGIWTAGTACTAAVGAYAVAGLYAAARVQEAEDCARRLEDERAGEGELGGEVVLLGVGPGGAIC